MKHIRAASSSEKLNSAALSVLYLAVSIIIAIALATSGTSLDPSVVIGGTILSVYFAINAVIGAARLLPRRDSPKTPRRHKETKQQESSPFRPPVSLEFEDQGAAFFISVTPKFMPRWLVHADPSSIVVNSMTGLLFVGLFRGVVRLFASLASWCLRQPWTVAVERWKSADGSNGWRFVLLEEYRSFGRAYQRRDEIVETWSEEDYAKRPIIGGDAR